MKTHIHPISRFLRREDGPTAVEYCFMLGLILLVCIVAVSVLGDATLGNFKTSADKIVN